MSMKKIIDARGVIVHQETDLQGRQLFKVRGLMGESLWSGRRRKGLINFLRSLGRTPFVYNELPKRTRMQISQLRVAEARATHKVVRTSRATLRDVWPV